MKPLSEICSKSCLCVLFVPKFLKQVVSRTKIKICPHLCAYSVLTDKISPSAPLYKTVRVNEGGAEMKQCIRRQGDRNERGTDGDEVI